jgi:demethylmenaquinone methyltransferase/2-methoxy-6-polyprenyl-1,4-benzoquinol methylase
MQNPTEVQRLFRQIAPHYDRMNRLMTLGQDLSWRRQAVRYLKPLQPIRLLDLAAGTGDFAYIAAQELPSLQEIYLVDFVPEMLAYAEKRGAPRPTLAWHTLIADAHALPFPDNYFDAITVGYGVRNFADRLTALKEMHRVLRPGGLALVLETGLPINPFWKALFWLYFRLYVPFLGLLVAKAKDAYTYLPESTRHFPHREKFLYLCQEAGFSHGHYKTFMGGVSILYNLQKS